MTASALAIRIHESLSLRNFSRRKSFGAARACASQAAALCSAVSRVSDMEWPRVGFPCNRRINAQARLRFRRRPRRDAAPRRRAVGAAAISASVAAKPSRTLR
jgi:hypothetical protein